MEIKAIKLMAYNAAGKNDDRIENDMCGMSVQERLYYLQMVYYYRLFRLETIKADQAIRCEQRILSDFKRLDNALRLSQENYQRQVRLAHESDTERVKLVKQMRAGDRDFIVTLLHLLDLYTGENIYAKIYQLMQPPLTDTELDAMISECPEEYRRGMTADEARTAVWRVIRHLNGDSGIA